jgi:hypothetical protein
MDPFTAISATAATAVAVVTGGIGSWMGQIVLGVLGNTAYDIGRHRFVFPAVEAWQEGKLPPNHDLHAAALKSLRAALRWAVESLAAEMDRPMPARWERRTGLAHARRFFEKFSVAQEDRWITEFDAAIDDDEVLAQFGVSELLPAGELTGILDPAASPSKSPAAQRFHDAAGAWASAHIVPSAPEVWEQNLARGFRADEKGHRLTLFEVWLEFIREALKRDERPFRAFVVAALAQQSAALPAAVEPHAVADGALQRLGQCLDQFAEQRTWMDSHFASIRLQNEELRDLLLASDARLVSIEAKIDKVLAVGERLGREVIAAKSPSTVRPAATASPATVGETDAHAAIALVARHYGVQSEVVALTLSQFVGAAKRERTSSGPAARMFARVRQWLGTAARGTASAGTAAAKAAAVSTERIRETMLKTAEAVRKELDIKPVGAVGRSVSAGGGWSSDDSGALLFWAVVLLLFNHGKINQFIGDKTGYFVLGKPTPKSIYPVILDDILNKKLATPTLAERIQAMQESGLWNTPPPSRIFLPQPTPSLFWRTPAPGLILAQPTPNAWGPLDSPIKSSDSVLSPELRSILGRGPQPTPLSLSEALETLRRAREMGLLKPTPAGTPAAPLPATPRAWRSPFPGANPLPSTLPPPSKEAR